MMLEPSSFCYDVQTILFTIAYCSVNNESQSQVEGTINLREFKGAKVIEDKQREC